MPQLRVTRGYVSRLSCAQLDCRSFDRMGGVRRGPGRGCGVDTGRSDNFFNRAGLLRKFGQLSPVGFVRQPGSVSCARRHHAGHLRAKIFMQQHDESQMALDQRRRVTWSPRWRFAQASNVESNQGVPRNTPRISKKVGEVGFGNFYPPL